MTEQNELNRILEKVRMGNELGEKLRREYLPWREDFDIFCKRKDKLLLPYKLTDDEEKIYIKYKKSVMNKTKS